MIEEFIYSVNILVSVFGFISCFYILMNNTLNKQTAKCVIPTCLAGFIWFVFLYSSLLQMYQPTALETNIKVAVFYCVLVWIDNNYKINLGEHYVRI